MKDTNKQDYEIHQSSLLLFRFPDESGLNSVDHMGKHFWDRIEHNDPMMIYMANGKINDLENIIHTESVREQLNQQPLHIYLYEPICGYIDDDPYAINNRFNNGFYSEFCDSSNISDMKSAELDSIQIYVENNRLHDVVVHTGDYQVEKFFGKYNMYMDLLCDDPFLKGFSLIDHVAKTPKKNMQKRFLSTSWRFTASRAVISAILCKKDTYLSWCYELERDILDKTPWFDVAKDNTKSANFYKRVIFGLTKLNQGSPWCLDFKTDKAVKVEESVGHYYPNELFENYGETNNPVFQNREAPTLDPYYRTVFLDVVCESRYAQPTANFSEKVLQSIHFMTPFLLVAPPYTLQYLKEFGFETFDQWWDESYDREENHSVRMQMIVDIIDYIDSLSWDNLNEMYLEMYPLLLRNRKKLADVFLIEPIPDKNHERPIYAQWLAKEHIETGDHHE